jgi:hypothetical protein
LRVNAPDCAARVILIPALVETALRKRMLILRGNATNDATIYPDETGKTRAWPEGALHEKAARCHWLAPASPTLIIFRSQSYVARPRE